MARNAQQFIEATLGALTVQNATLISQVEALMEENQKLREELKGKDEPTPASA